MITKARVALLAFAIAKSCMAQQFAVRANPGQWKGVSNTEVIFQQFEIRLFTEGDSDKHPLNWQGEADFDVDRSKVRRLEWTTPAQPPPKFVLWPKAFEAGGQQGVPNPFTRFQLLSLKELCRETKTDAADSIRGGSFDRAETILHDVTDLYDPFFNFGDPKLSSDLSLFVHQIYESMTDAAVRFRKSNRFRTLSAEDRTKVLDLERGWHRFMIDRYANQTDEAVNRRLAATLRRWSEFARALHCRGEWPSDSINTAEDKKPATLLGDMSALREDLSKVTGVLFSDAVAPGLRERIKKNLAPNVRNGASALEAKQLACYDALAASHEKVEDIQLDDLDRAISGFQYFYHAESGK
jgi:hypothetical protein